MYHKFTTIGTNMRMLLLYPRAQTVVRNNARLVAQLYGYRPSCASLCLFQGKLFTKVVGTNIFYWWILNEALRKCTVA